MEACFDIHYVKLNKVKRRIELEPSVKSLESFFCSTLIGQVALVNYLIPRTVSER